MVSVAPVIWHREVSKLPDSEERKCHKAEPTTLVNSVEPDSSVENSIAEPSQFIPSVDNSVS